MSKEENGTRVVWPVQDGRDRFVRVSYGETELTSHADSDLSRNPLYYDPRDLRQGVLLSPTGALEEFEAVVGSLAHMELRSLPKTVNDGAEMTEVGKSIAIT